MPRYYVVPDDKIINSFAELKKYFPQSSLPQNVDLPALNTYIINPTPVPDFDPASQYPKELSPRKGEDGRYYQVWLIVNIVE